LTIEALKEEMEAKTKFLNILKNKKPRRNAGFCSGGIIENQPENL